MTELLINIIICGLWIAGLTLITSSGYIFHPLVEPFEYHSQKVCKIFVEQMDREITNARSDGKNGKMTDIRIKYEKRSERLMFWLKPIIMCPTCMGSIHGFLFYCCLMTDFNLIHLPIFMVGASATGTIFTYLSTPE